LPDSPRKVYGARIRIGDGPFPPDEPGTVSGADFDVDTRNLPDGTSVVGLQISVGGLAALDSVVNQIIKELAASDSPKRARAIALAQEILRENQPKPKTNKIRTLISYAGDIASIAGLVAALARLAEVS
jgi:hypothetical protein